MLGMSDGAEQLHYLLELPPDSPAFLHDVEAGDRASRATRSTRSSTRPATPTAAPRAGRPSGCCRTSSRRRPSCFTGEHVFPWMFEDYGALAPLREAAELLAAHEWPRLYDAVRLAANEVPAAAAIYANDMYVQRAFSEETAARSAACACG